MPLPLRIFEERYRIMTREQLGAGRPFVVLLIKEGREVGGGAIPHNVGTIAVIEQAEEVEGGRFNIAVRGPQRVRLVRMLEPRPYPSGDIELIDDDIGEGDRRP